MKKIFLITGLLFSVCAVAQIEKVLPNQKNPPRLYNDFTKAGSFLTSEQAQALEQRSSAPIVGNLAVGLFSEFCSC